MSSYTLISQDYTTISISNLVNLIYYEKRNYVSKQSGEDTNTNSFNGLFLLCH